MKKTYQALVQGYLDPAEGTIDAPIGRHPSRDFKMAVVAGGRSAITHYRTLESLPRATLVELQLETGRTHQIRVHMQAIGHAIVGDPTYGANPLLAKELGMTRQWLHAMSLGFTHPVSGEQVSFEAPLAADLEDALTRLRRGF